MEKSPIQEYYTGKRLQAIAASWRRKKDGAAVCGGFCKHVGTDRCPHNGNYPKKGHCERFLIKADSLYAVHDLLVSDAARSGIDLNKLSVSVIAAE